VVVPDVAVTVIAYVPAGVPVAGGGGGVELDPPPQPTRTVAAAIGISMRQIDSARRRVRARPASFCIQPSIMAMTKRRASDAIGAICRNDGGCISVEGCVNGTIELRAVVV